MSALVQLISNILVHSGYIGNQYYLIERKNIERHDLTWLAWAKPQYIVFNIDI